MRATTENGQTIIFYFRLLAGPSPSHLNTAAGIGEAAGDMCPLRFIIVFLSATLAGYFVLKSIRSPSSCAVLEDPVGEEHSEGELKKDRSVRVGRMIGAGFWVFLDMASGRYLWRFIKER